MPTAITIELIDRVKGDVRDVLRSNGVPIRSGSALCGAASLCGAAAGGCRLR